MKKTILTLTLMFAVTSIFAQNKQGTYRVKNGSNVSEAIPFSERFQNDRFHEGLVYFRNGRSSRASMNYSLVHGEVMFIGPTKDTMLLNDNDYVTKIQIGEQAFQYNKGHGHVEIIGDYGKASLGRKYFLVRSGNERYAAYNQYSSTSAIDTYTSFINPNGNFQFLEGSDKAIFRRREIFFLVDRNQQFYLLNRNAFSRVYRGHKQAIDDFIRTNNPNLESEEDIKKLLSFCSTL